MVVLKRKPVSEKERYEGYDNVIDLDDRKSYNASQKETAETGLYTQREAFVSAKPREEVMPRIKKETKAIPQAKQGVSSKTKVLLAAYIIIAVVLAAVVIGTGVAITEVGRRTSALETDIETFGGLIQVQNEQLAVVRDDSHQMGEATKLGMEVIDEVTEVTLLRSVEVPAYSATTNWFDSLCDFLSRIF